jgi:putative N-acetyltransferase (TIGR04045 family)
MNTQEPLCELSTAFMPCEFRIKWADSVWEVEHARRLRRAVFCAEQGVFALDDSDEIDKYSQPLVALSCVGGMSDQVVGTVRIHRDAGSLGQDDDQAVWWGSRLAVHASFRRHGRLGETLIRLAVGSARALGAQVFLAHVQEQNQRLFEKLNWVALRSEKLHGRAHVLMQAEISCYPPCHQPLSGFVTAFRSA